SGGIHGNRSRNAAESVRDSAMCWWESIRRQAIEEHQAVPNQWEVFKKKVMRQYQPMEMAEISRKALHTLRQRGSVIDYINTFNKHLNAIPNMGLEDQLFLFKNGLKPDIQEKMLANPPKQLMEAMVMAQRIEASKSSVYNWQRRNYPSSFSHSSSSSSSHNTSAPMELGNMEEKKNEQASGDDEDGDGVNAIKSGGRGGFRQLSDSDKQRMM